MHVKNTQAIGEEIAADNNLNRTTRPLQHFEHAVLSMVSALEYDAFPANITRLLGNQLNRPVSLAQVFVVLERLEDKDFVSSTSVKPPTPTRGGRRRRVFKIETPGKWALANAAATAGVSPVGENLDASKRQKAPSPA
jgi:DNA-binding PadR family transcriptional regulator